MNDLLCGIPRHTSYSQAGSYCMLKDRVDFLNLFLKPEHIFIGQLYTDFDEDGTQKVRAESRLSDSEKRQHPKQYGLRCDCPKCNSRIEGVPTTVWKFSKPGRLTLINPKLFTVDKNDTGSTRVVIDPKYYHGKLKMDTEIDWFDLYNVPWNLAVTYASKETVYIPDPSYYMLFSLREFAGISACGDPVAPVISSRQPCGSRRQSSVRRDHQRS